MHKSKLGRVILIIALVVVIIRTIWWIRSLMQLSDITEIVKPKIDRTRGVLRGIYETVRSKSKPRDEA